MKKPCLLYNDASISFAVFDPDKSREIRRPVRSSMDAEMRIESFRPAFTFHHARLPKSGILVLCKHGHTPEAKVEVALIAGVFLDNNEGMEVPK